MFKRNENFRRGHYDGCEYARTWAAWPGKILAQLENVQGGKLQETRAYELGYVQALQDAIETIHQHERQQPC